jgi:ATP-dependent Lon protease
MEKADFKQDFKLNKTEMFLPVLPLKNIVALPKSIIPVIVGRKLSIKAVEYALKHGKQIFVTTQKTVDIETPKATDIFHNGTRASILQVARMPNGSLKILIEGSIRSNIIEVLHTNEFIGVLAKDVPSIKPESPLEQQALWRNLYKLFKNFIKINEKIPADILNALKGAEDLDYLTDTIAVQLSLSLNDRQKLLETADLKQRSIKLSAFIQNEIEILKTEKTIRKQVQKQVEKNQKDYYLNEQMRAIQRELGRENYQQEIDELREQSKKLKLSKEAQDKVNAECKRLEQMQPTSPEAAVSRNYVDTLLNVPWYKNTKDTVSITQAEKILESTHAGMEKAKERILEFLATKKFAGDKLKKSPIICLVGPPGTGKTSLAHSIAKSLGRKFTRISLGGMRDEAEIRGHRKTYIGAMPGKIIQAMKKVGIINPVIILDEIDKMSVDFRGDPASALLEVLDPEQNYSFVDYFLDVDYDLSKTMFITTANVMDNIPYPLLDRMEIIHLSGYTDKEKLKIAKNFLLPKLLKEHALRANKIKIPEAILEKVIYSYTKEAGVRLLEQTIAKLLRKSIQELQKNKTVKTVTISDKKLEQWLGPEKYKQTRQLDEDLTGLATGLAWTEVGGDVLEIEVAILKGKGSLSLTGQLGEVMQESAQAALSYIRSRAKKFGLKEDFYSDYDIHIHIPEGAIPKDGPSAGITMATALTSALIKTPVVKHLAMTGEVTLRGRILAVGGLKEKLLAAIRFGIKKVFVPKENKNDIKEFEKELDSSLELIYVDHLDEVLRNALEKNPFDVKVKAKKKAVKKKK